jgi:small subunit ribosomal protein S1
MFENTNNIINANVSIDKFNWNMYESLKREDHIKDLYKEIGITTINKYEILKGVITKILEKEIIVDIHFKYEGIISINEFRNNKSLKVGDFIDVMVEKIYKGQLILSHRKVKIRRAWERAKEAYKNREIITGKVTGRTKGGMIVRILDHIEAFMPGSQIDPKPLFNFDNFYSEVYNKSMEFKILKINNEYKNIVVSHKALIEDEIEKQKKKFISELQPGQIIIAKVKNITSYGAFCDMGGVDGLVHNSDISWKRINHPSDVLKINEKVKVVVLDFNEDKNRIQLGIKQILPHPWNSLDKNIQIGNKIKGKVIAVTEYGAFVEIENYPGVEALLHVSEISWSNQLKLAKDFVKIDDEIEAVILSLDRKEKKMSLGIKQLTKSPWIEIKEKYKEGTKHKGMIRHITNYGIFVELQEGIDGMIHNSDLSCTKKFKHPSEIFKLGDIIETVVLEMNLEHQRIHLGYKQLI